MADRATGFIAPGVLFVAVLALTRARLIEQRLTPRSRVTSPQI